MDIRSELIGNDDNMMGDGCVCVWVCNKKIYLLSFECTFRSNEASENPISIGYQSSMVNCQCRVRFGSMVLMVHSAGDLVTWILMAAVWYAA